MYIDINGKPGTHSLQGNTTLWGDTTTDTFTEEDEAAMLADGVKKVEPKPATPKAPPSAEKIEAKRIRALNGVCEAKIYEVYSREDQANAHREATRLVRKEAKGEASQEDIDRLTELDKADKWISDMIDFCREKKADGTTTAGDLEYIDTEAEPDEMGRQPVVSKWPAPPDKE